MNTPAFSSRYVRLRRSVHSDDDCVELAVDSIPAIQLCGFVIVMCVGVFMISAHVNHGTLKIAAITVCIITCLVLLSFYVHMYAHERANGVVILINNKSGVLCVPRLGLRVPVSYVRAVVVKCEKAKFLPDGEVGSENRSSIIIEVESPKMSYVLIENYLNGSCVHAKAIARDLAVDLKVDLVQKVQ